MASAILLSAMAGDKFHVAAGDLVYLTDKDKERWLSENIARELLSTEPTELQTARAYSFLPKDLGETPLAKAENNLQPKPKPRKKIDVIQ